MAHSSLDPFYKFIELYEKGQIQQSFELILSNPEVQYESLQSSEPLFRYIINFVDACVYKGAIDIYGAIKTLIKVLTEDKKIATLASQFIEILIWEQNFLELLSQQLPSTSDPDQSKDFYTLINELKAAPELTEEEVSHFIDFIPLYYRPFTQDRIWLLRDWKKLVTSKPFLQGCIKEEGEIVDLLPWHYFAYPLPHQPLQDVNANETPLIFLEPILNANYAEILAPFSEKTAIFVFQTLQSLLQLLHFPAVALSLKQPKHYIYILDLYPQQQIALQKMSEAQFKRFKPLIQVPHHCLTEAMPVLIDTLTKCLKQSPEELKTDSPIANGLYQISKRLLFRMQAERYGKSRYMALSISEGYNAWHNTHKGRPPTGLDLGPLHEDFLDKELRDNVSHRKVRAFAPQNKVRIAHIVPQVALYGHAPTKLLVNLLSYADHSWFDFYLFSTERLAVQSLEYPVPHYFAASSSIIGDPILQHLSSMGVKIHIEPDPSTYRATAMHMAELLKKMEIDIAVFHGPDEVNSLCASITDVPVRVFFEHGTLPKPFCFDLAILSTEDEFNAHKEEYRKQGMESCYLNFCMDASSTWEKEPYTKEKLGFPANSFIMTTISNHLDTRLSTDMCQAIGEILSQCPKAYYAPIGAVINRERIRTILEPYGVNERVIFLGEKGNPSQYARSMELYLNEFPFGSCLGMLDAMACGCPVVSLYDEKGPPQSKYAGVYFGKDRVITTGKKEDYVKLACTLIKDPEIYKEWSEHAKAQYSKHVDVQGYVKNFEKILEIYIQYFVK